jgi:hypothetical protein
MRLELVNQLDNSNNQTRLKEEQPYHPFNKINFLFKKVIFKISNILFCGYLIKIKIFKTVSNGFQLFFLNTGIIKRLNKIVSVKC